MKQTRLTAKEYQKKSKPNKYKNKKVEYRGLMFDSQMEFEYYLYITNVVYSKDIFSDIEIKLQPEYELLEKFEKNGKKYRAINYRADFEICKNGKPFRVIDIKGFPNPLFLLKEKMFNHKYKDITLEIITKSPKWCEEYALDGWIETSELKKLRAKRKKGLI